MTQPGTEDKYPGFVCHEIYLHPRHYGTVSILSREMLHKSRQDIEAYDLPMWFGLNCRSLK